MYYEELAHATVEAEKFHHLPSASWKPRKAIGVIESELECEGLQTKGANDVNPSLRAEECKMRCPSLVSEAGKKKSTSSFFHILFYSGLWGIG